MRNAVVSKMVDAGIPEQEAEKHWRTVVDALCHGQTPTVIGLALLTDDDILGALPGLAGRALIAAARDHAGKASVAVARSPEKPKQKRFKPGRTYTAEEYVSFYLEEPGNQALLATIFGATDGKAWLVPSPSGPVATAESARYIQWHMDGDIAPATVDVEGVPVAPVLPGEEKAERLYYVDPFSPGDFLDANMGSSRTGASFLGYSDESLSAMAYLFESSLRGEGNLSLNRLASENRRRSPHDILSPFLVTYAAWLKLKPEQRPAAKAAMPKATVPVVVAKPVAGTFSAAPCVYVMVGGAKHADRWQTLRANLRGPERMGLVRVLDDYSFEACNVEQRHARNLAAADVVAVLVSAANHAADEVHRALEYCQETGKRFIPVVVGGFAMQFAPFAHLVPLPVHGAMSDEKAAEVSSAIVAVAQKHRSR